MKKRSAFILILLLSVFVMACVPKQPAKTAVEVQPETEVETLPTETVLEKAVEKEKEPAEEPRVQPIGTRFKPAAEEVPKPTAVPSTTEGIIVLTKQKTMSADLKVITNGETLTWRNDDTFPHQIVVELNGVRISGGQRMNSGDTWSFTFNKLGEHLVRDIFSGNMRMLVRVEP